MSPPQHPADRPVPAYLARSLDMGIGLGLVLAILAVYAQVVGFEFVSFDDALYITGNPHVQAGLTLESIRWAFTSAVASNWMPLTLLSHMLDVQLFGLNSGLHHLVNVLLHALAAWLLYRLLFHCTGSRWPSAFVAFMFALHPLHVESVAWISERKDVLSTVLWFLTLDCYVRYTERPQFGRYLMVIGSFSLGLMSKPMLVTLPATLLLFDFWPLRRVAWPRILWEKVPLIALSVAASLATFLVQQRTGALDQQLPLDSRLANALVSYLTYLWQTVCPLHLSAIYPMPAGILAWKAGLALVVLLGISVFTVRAIRTRPYLAVGWFWFLGTLVPVIGLIQVGNQAHADRYMYVPMVGISIMLAWGVAEVLASRPALLPIAKGAAAIACVVWLVLAAIQTATWRNGETVFAQALSVTQDNAIAHNNLACYLLAFPDRHGEAVEHLEAAVRIKPAYAEAHNNLGFSLLQAGLCSVAMPHFHAALRSKPSLAEANNNLGECLVRSQNYAAAINYFEAALANRPGYVDARFSLARALKQAGRSEEAVSQFSAGLQLRQDPAASCDLAELLVSLGRRKEAIERLERAQSVQPDSVVARTLKRLESGK